MHICTHLHPNKAQVYAKSDTPHTYIFTHTCARGCVYPRTNAHYTSVHTKTHVL